MDAESGWFVADVHGSLSDRARKSLSGSPCKSPSNSGNQIFPMCTESLTGGDHLTKFLMVCETDWESGGEEDRSFTSGNPINSDVVSDCGNDVADDQGAVVIVDDESESDVIVVDDGDEIEFLSEDEPMFKNDGSSDSSVDNEDKGDFNCHEDDVISFHTRSSCFRCPVCQKNFGDVETFFQHKAKHIQIDLASCQICIRGFTEVQELEAHKHHHEEYGNDDSVIVNIIESLDVRVENKSIRKERYPCPKCRQYFDNEQSLEQHLANHAVKNVVCVLCEHKFSQSKHLMKHIASVHKGEKPFSCVYCLKECCNMTDLKEHLNIHRDEIDMKCIECKRQFNYRSDYKRHISSHTKPGHESHQCSLCDKKFKSAEALRKHFKLHEGLSPFACIVCHNVAKDKEDLRSHMSEHKENTCHICQKQYRWLSDLKRHINKHKAKESEKRDVVCPVCLTECPSPSKLKRHMLTHKKSEESFMTEALCSDDSQESKTPSSNVVKPRDPQITKSHKSYSCNECSSTFTCKRDLERHVKEHPATCSECKEQFKDQRSLSIHLKQVHLSANAPIERETFLCSVCGTTFLTKKGLNNHMYEHTGATKRHVCNICGRGMNSSALLEEHMRRHRGEKPFMCDQCAKMFTTRSGLKIHLQCHSSERPHVCPVCDKGFNRAGSLRTHMEIHSGNRPFGCCICPKTFNQEHSLEEHMKMHSGEKPYVCDVCEKRFSVHQYLKQHQKIHLPTRLHQCYDCKKRFSTPQGLYQHSKTHRERPFSCNQCDRKFTHEQNLRLHIETHSNNYTKRHRCQVCEKCFSSPQGLYQHRRTHRDKAFKCDQCERTFARLRELKEHIYNHQTEEDVDDSREWQVTTRSSTKRSDIISQNFQQMGRLSEAGDSNDLLMATDRLYQQMMGEGRSGGDQPGETMVDQRLNEKSGDRHTPYEPTDAYPEQQADIDMNTAEVEQAENGDSQTTVYYEPTAGLLYFEQPELASHLIQDDKIQQSLLEIVENLSKENHPSSEEHEHHIVSSNGEATAASETTANEGTEMLRSSADLARENAETQRAVLEKRESLTSGEKQTKSQDLTCMTEQIYALPGEGICHKVNGVQTSEPDQSVVMKSLMAESSVTDMTVEEMSSGYTTSPGSQQGQDELENDTGTGDSSSSSGDDNDDDDVEWVEVDDYA